MKVGPLSLWVKHLDKGDSKPFLVYQESGTLTDPMQMWVVESQTLPTVRYRVYYQRNHLGEFIQCNCKAGRCRMQCKHCAYVLAHIHGPQMRALLREHMRRAAR